MSHMKKEIGSISETFNDSEFHWIINSDEVLELDSFHSPKFSFSSCSWYLRMHPNGETPEHKGCVSLFLFCNELDPSIEVTFSLCMTLKEVQLMKHSTTHCFKKIEKNRGWSRYVLKKEVLDCLSKRKKSCRQLTITVKMKYHAPHKDLLAVRMKGKETLSQNYKDLLLRGEDHDLVLEVKDKKLKAHRNIMQCRCPVFKSMLTHEMLEKEKGVVVIPDCDPLAFEQFLFYVYTGELEKLDKSTMLGLYYIADKYDMESLKEECSSFIKQSLSAHVFCDVLMLALNHSDLVLQEFATKYFLKNAIEILVTAEWKTFMKENTSQANELLIKAFDKLPLADDHTDSLIDLFM